MTKGRLTAPKSKRLSLEEANKRTDDWTRFAIERGFYKVIHNADGTKSVAVNSACDTPLDRLQDEFKQLHGK